MLRHLITAVVAAGLVAAVLCGVFWRRSARDLAKRLYYGPNNPNARPDLERFGFDPDLEFSATPTVHRSVKDPENPDFIVQQGLEVKLHATGFTYPTNLAFPVRGSSGGTSGPAYYVAELHGAVKWVDADGKVGVFADKLLNFKPTKMRISDELGVSGIAAIPETSDLLITHPVYDAKTDAYYNAVTRLYGDGEGRKCVKREQLLLMADEPTAPSNQIQQVVVGPDGKVYISVGDAMNYTLSKDVNRWGGKILRMDLDGSACSDNPFYDPQMPRAPKNYVFAFGLRNCFDFVMDPAGRILAGDVGPDVNRLVWIARGDNLGWDGTRESLCRNAAYLSENNRIVPVGGCYVEPGLGSEFAGQVWFASYSNHFGPGPNGVKRIVSFTVEEGRLDDGPQGILAYVGAGQTTPCGMKAGPDGVYFTDFFGEQTSGNADGQGRVLRISTSERTAKLPVDRTPRGWQEWDPLKRGKYVFVHHGNCASCHTVTKISAGREGPNLTHVATELRKRLRSQEYHEQIEGLLKRASDHVRPDLAAIQAATGDDRVRLWIRKHIRNPTFDNPRAKMPSLAFLTEEEVDCLVQFLMTME